MSSLRTEPCIGQVYAGWPMKDMSVTAFCYFCTLEQSCFQVPRLVQMFGPTKAHRLVCGAQLDLTVALALLGVLRSLVRCLLRIPFRTLGCTAKHGRISTRANFRNLEQQRVEGRSKSESYVFTYCFASMRWHPHGKNSVLRQISYVIFQEARRQRVARRHQASGALNTKLQHEVGDGEDLNAELDSPKQQHTRTPGCSTLLWRESILLKTR